MRHPLLHHDYVFVFFMYYSLDLVFDVYLGSIILEAYSAAYSL